MIDRTLAARWAAAGWLEAAGEIWSEARAASRDPVERAEAAFNLGLIAKERGLHDRARVFFEETLGILSHTPLESLRIEAGAHLGLAFARLGRHRNALRLLGSVPLDGGSEWAAGRVGLAIEVARLKIDQGWSRSALRELEGALAEPSPSLYPRFRTSLLTELGIVRLEEGRVAAAREFFRLALETPGPEAIVAANELARLEMREGNPEHALAYTGALADNVWHTWLGLDKWYMANLIEVMGRHAEAAGDSALAGRLWDQARALYGQIGAWRAWKRVGTVSSPAPRSPSFPGRESLVRFSFVLDGVLAQELADPVAVARIEARSHAAQAMARALGWSAERRRALALVVRLADYGLTAMEPLVAEAPRRSPSAWARYIRHPELGTRLLTAQGIEPPVLEAIRDHHERADGLGFPAGKTDKQIDPMARVYAVADRYAEVVVPSLERHRMAVETILSQRGAELSPAMVDLFLHVVSRPGIAPSFRDEPAAPRQPRDFVQTP